MKFPDSIRASRLYARLMSDSELLAVVNVLRGNTLALASSIERTVPMFTDHSTKHMDGLWEITESVLLHSEIEAMNSAEAFLLAASFYLHDIGMAFAATDEGLRRCLDSSVYKALMAATPEESRSLPETLALALATAVRSNHAEAAITLSIETIPGTDKFLVEPADFRSAWGKTIGEIAASHNWSLEKLDASFGKVGISPLPGGRKADLGYVACILRVVDFAHMNRDRSEARVRAFRGSLNGISRLHWIAQENIDGPLRADNELQYRASSPIVDVDAWWLFYEMLSEFDTEIRLVRKYLNKRRESTDRFSLQGVRGAVSPQEAATYIPTDGFLPIEVNLRTGAIDRLVSLLAGESLYGPNPMVAVRELIQNARDAVMLKVATAETEIDKASLTIPIKVALGNDANCEFLEVSDWGVGMTPKIITDFLIAIASDYWESQFHVDFPRMRPEEFRPAGKFGIGFLSVFLLGDRVHVESGRAGGQRSRLFLQGVARRGELRSLGAQTGSGTVIRVELKKEMATKLSPLAELVKSYCPLIPHPLEVSDLSSKLTLNPGWLFSVTQEDFKKWVLKTYGILQSTQTPGFKDEDDIRSYRIMYARPGSIPEKSIWNSQSPEYQDENVRLLASFEGISILCLKGITVQAVRTPGFLGVINIDTASPDVSRSKIIGPDISEVITRATHSTRSDIISNIDSMAEKSFIGNNLDFIARCVSLYGSSILLESNTKWISHVKLPGEVELLSSSAFLKKAATCGQVFYAYNTGPWTTLKKWEQTSPEHPQNEIAIVLDRALHQSPSYRSGDETVKASISEIWSDCSDRTLFHIILELLAEAWQTNVGALLQQTTCYHSGSTIWGQLKK